MLQNGMGDLESSSSVDSYGKYKEPGSCSLNVGGKDSLHRILEVNNDGLRMVGN